jgi:hypothetical protein
MKFYYVISKNTYYRTPYFNVGVTDTNVWILPRNLLNNAYIPSAPMYLNSPHWSNYIPNSCLFVPSIRLYALESKGWLGMFSFPNPDQCWACWNPVNECWTDQVWKHHHRNSLHSRNATWRSEKRNWFRRKLDRKWEGRYRGGHTWRGRKHQLCIHIDLEIMRISSCVNLHTAGGREDVGK